jgi:hypothetical protein
MADLERVLQQFHDSEINAGGQTFFDAGMRIGASVMDQLSLPLRSCALRQPRKIEAHTPSLPINSSLSPV